VTRIGELGTLAVRTHASFEEMQSPMYKIQRNTKIPELLRSEYPIYGSATENMFKEVINIYSFVFLNNIDSF
jgi:hypothetical protein